jgi:hypothetical protein
MNTISIGRPCSWSCKHERKGYAVYERLSLDGSPATYLIARLPSSKAPDTNPASVSRDFKTLQAAIATLERWASKPPAPRWAPKARKLGACRRNSNWKRPGKVGAGQMDMDLGFDPIREGRGSDGPT